jgi:hypothetical protein
MRLLTKTANCKLNRKLASSRPNQLNGKQFLKDIRLKGRQIIILPRGTTCLGSVLIGTRNTHSEKHTVLVGKPQGENRLEIRSK